VQCRLAVRPNAFLQRTTQLRTVRLANEVGTLVIERRVQEEASVLDFEMLARLANATLSQGDKLLAFGERADGDRPFFERDWHRSTSPREDEAVPRQRQAKDTQ
jgi:hypothetical protein